MVYSSFLIDSSFLFIALKAKKFYEFVDNNVITFTMKAIALKMLVFDQGKTMTTDDDDEED